MTAATFTPSQISALTSTGNTSSSSSTASSATTNAISANGIANNFQEFLTLLTTQLQNQNPLDPLDTNQFTQQLVEFAGVEQQLNLNTQMTSLISLQQAAQNTQIVSEILKFVGTTVAVNGSTTPLSNGQAQWGFTTAAPATATFTITDASGQTVYSKTSTVQAGNQSFTWDGKDNSGQKVPDGNYKLTVTATGADGKPVGVSTEVHGVVDSVDLTQTPPTLSIGGQNYTADQILRVLNPSSTSS
jgi:flagellar basal-body rod modification protein FlgD